MIKKMMLLAGMALAVVAVAAPAAQANWTHSGEELESNATVGLSGSMNIEVPGVAGAHSEVHIGLTLKSGSTGTVTSYSDTKCTGTAQLNGLRCTVTAENLPWLAHIDPFVGKIRVTNIKLTHHYYSILDPGHVTSLTTTVTTGNVLLDPDSRTGFSVFDFEGEGTLINGNPAVIGGSVGVSPAGTYGIE